MTKLSEQIQSLLTYANGVTGEEDTTLGDAVRTLADGFGGSGGFTKIEGTITFDSAQLFTLSDSRITKENLYVFYFISDEGMASPTQGCYVEAIGFNPSSFGIERSINCLMTGTKMSSDTNLLNTRYGTLEIKTDGAIEIKDSAYARYVIPNVQYKWTAWIK